MHERCSNPCAQLAAVSTRRLRAANSCFVKGFAPEQHHFVRALLREHASFDNRMMLSHFMVQMVELIAATDDADIEYPTPPDTPRGSASDNECCPTWLAMKFDLEIQVHVLSGHNDANKSVSYTFG